MSIFFLNHTLQMERKQQQQNDINIAQTKQAIKIIIFYEILKPWLKWIDCQTKNDLMHKSVSVKSLILKIKITFLKSSQYELHNN